jgi:hypothetical protein
MQYQIPAVRDFGSIAAHTFIGQKNTIGPGHIDAHAECSGGSGSGSYATPCFGKEEPRGTYD